MRVVVDERARETLRAFIPSKRATHQISGFEDPRSEIDVRSGDVRSDEPAAADLLEIVLERDEEGADLGLGRLVRRLVVCPEAEPGDVDRAERRTEAARRMPSASEVATKTRTTSTARPWPAQRVSRRVALPCRR